jgi:hypothetical protein
MKRISTVLIIILLAAVAAQADIYIKSKVHTDPVSFMGQNQPATDTVSEQWIGDSLFATVTGGTTNIIDLKKNVMLMVNHKDKSYVETTLPLDMSKIMPAEMAGMAQAMMKMTVAVTPTGQTKTVGSWSCSGYDVSLKMMMMPMKIQVWATTDVPFDVEAYAKNAYGNMIKAQFRLDDAAVQEMLKIRGLWILAETSAEMMGAKIRTVSEVVEVGKKTAPAAVYAVPAGYKKMDRFSMQQMQQR